MSHRFIDRPVTWITRTAAGNHYGVGEVESAIHTGQVRTRGDRGIEELALEDISKVLMRLLNTKKIRHIRAE